MIPFLMLNSINIINHAFCITLPYFSHCCDHFLCSSGDVARLSRANASVLVGCRDVARCRGDFGENAMELDLADSRKSDGEVLGMAKMGEF